MWTDENSDALNELVLSEKNVGEASHNSTDWTEQEFLSNNMVFMFFIDEQ